MNKKQKKQFNQMIKKLMKLNKATYSWWLQRPMQSSKLTLNQMRDYWKKIGVLEKGETWK